MRFRGRRVYCKNMPIIRQQISGEHPLQQSAVSEHKNRTLLNFKVALSKRGEFNLMSLGGKEETSVSEVKNKHGTEAFLHQITLDVCDDVATFEQKIHYTSKVWGD